ncbi:MAG TPA: nuclear transport factor 2 family protein [Candidatus Acidoferrales bacterium]|nr:nuclear transport factor 2 family protein [Candidatus Acidoferrales bacterium]
MESLNCSRMRQYLQAVSTMAPFENVAQFFAPDIVVQEFPNRISPVGRISRWDEIRAGYERGRKIMLSQSYEVKHIVESADEIAVELEWSGTLAVPIMKLPSGSEMKASVAMFLTFRDGRIVSQRNYDCYPPFEAS